MTDQEFKKRLAEIIIGCSKGGLLSINDLIPGLHALFKQANYVKLSPDQSWHCNGRVFAIGLSPKNFVEMLKGRGFRKVEV